MDKNTEKINKYLTNLNLPEYKSNQHRDKLRNQVLNTKQGSKVMPKRNKFLKVAAIIGLIISIGAIATAVTVKIYTYRYEGQDRDGAYHFTTEKTFEDENGQTSATISSVMITRSPNDVMDVEQELKELEEIDLLRQDDNRELAGVVEKYVNGNFERTMSFAYTLSDGRIKNMGEEDPDMINMAMSRNTEQDQQEIDALRETGKRKLFKVIDTWTEDNFSRTFTYQYTLSDGFKKYITEPDPEMPVLESFLNEMQIGELWDLRRLKDGQYLGYDNKEVQGKTFEFETYIFTLADGTEVNHSIGTPTGKDKIQLTNRDWEEFRELEEGQQLEPEVKEIRGKMFLFERTLFVLSDGTEIIFCDGNPIDDK